MQVRIGSCTHCEATFQLPADFGSPWVRCRICEHAVEVGEPEDLAEAGKRKRRGAGSGSRAGAAASNGKAGTTGAKTALSGAAAAAVASAAAAAAKTKESAAKSAAEQPTGAKTSAAPKSTSAADVLDVSAEESVLIEDTRSTPVKPRRPDEKPVREIPARPLAPASEPKQSTWSPAELERRARAEAESQTAEVEHAAERVAPAAAPAASELREVTREKKKSGGGTLERLKAERARQAALAKMEHTGPRPSNTPPTDAVAAPKKKGGTLERLKAERAAAAKASGAEGNVQRSASFDAPVAKRQSSGAATSSGVKSSTSRSSSRRGEPESSERGSRSRRARPSKKKEKSPAAGLIGIAAILGLGGFAWFATKSDMFGSKEAAAADSAGDVSVETVADATPAEATPDDYDPFAAATLPDDTAAEDGAPEDGAAADAESSADGAAAGGETAADSGGEAAGAATEGSTAPAEPVDTGRDPALVDLAILEPLEPMEGTDPEVWETAQRLAKKILDPGTTRGMNTAREELVAIGRAAFPAVVNEMLTLDVSTSNGVSVGDGASKVLIAIANKQGYAGWKQRTDNDSQYFNKSVIAANHKKWLSVANDDEAWAKFAKLDPETMLPIGAAPPADSAEDEGADSDVADKDEADEYGADDADVDEDAADAEATDEDDGGETEGESEEG